MQRRAGILISAFRRHLADLGTIYSYRYDYELPQLYAMIFSDVWAKEVEILTRRLQNEIDRYQLSIADLTEDSIYELCLLILQAMKKCQESRVFYDGIEKAAI